ncbi:hypothetical protein BUALT_Bualt03G0009000 [Buddleja alternifolia]|uniref:Protein PHLOEM PROTEIN 2-LIKE A1 n=1 Tax=Buddleja alternifolia TaxID=168488 RepID=A0AAV6XSB9_9LAMI|nr:hypothetical protein BUALT_Bualt03G0009000 [Buddleja alternifolia]
MDGGDEGSSLSATVDLSAAVVELTGKVHQLPCCIKYDGPTSVSHYFKPKLTGRNGGGWAKSGGSILQRKEITWHHCFILGKKSSDKKINTENSNCWETNATFQNVTVWNHDAMPSKDDAFLRAFHWFTVSKTILKKHTRLINYTLQHIKMLKLSFAQESDSDSFFYIMGAGLSQDNAPQPNEEESRNDTSQSRKNDAKPNQTITQVPSPHTRSSKNDAKPNQTITQVPLPHNNEDILKHADSPIDRSSTKKLLEQLYSGVFLNGKRKKYWVEKESNRNCFILFARDLLITWAEDNRFWHWPLLNESSDESLAVAELLNVCWLEVHGRFEIAHLSPGTLYEVVFVVQLKDSAYGWEVPVNLRLTLPDGSRQEQKQNLMAKPRGQWIEIPAGEFKASTDKAGEMEFSLYEYEGGKWKRGLLIKEVSIRPKA